MRQKSDAITFIDEEVREIQTPHDDTMVISLIIANYDVKHILVDNGSSANVLLYEAFPKNESTYTKDAQNDYYFDDVRWRCCFH